MASGLVSFDDGCEVSLSLRKTDHLCRRLETSATPWAILEDLQTDQPKEQNMAVGGRRGRVAESLRCLAGLSHRRGDPWTRTSPTGSRAAEKRSASNEEPDAARWPQFPPRPYLSLDSLPTEFRRASEPAGACGCEQLWRDLRPKKRLGRLPVRAR